MSIRPSGLWCDICNTPILDDPYWNISINGKPGHACKNCSDVHMKGRRMSKLTAINEHQALIDAGRAYTKLIKYVDDYELTVKADAEQRHPGIPTNNISELKPIRTIRNHIEMLKGLMRPALDAYEKQNETVSR